MSNEAAKRLTEWVSDVEAGHDTVGADPLTTAILRRRAADTLTVLADLARMKAALEPFAKRAELWDDGKRLSGDERWDDDRVVCLSDAVETLEADLCVGDFRAARLALRQHGDGR